MDNPSAPLAHTRHGSVLGCREAAFDVWRGIPFAAPPVGARRNRWNPGKGFASPTVFLPPAGKTASIVSRLAGAIRVNSLKIASTLMSGRPLNAKNRCL